MQSQVVVFMKGLNEGRVRNELYRQFPSTLEEAITLALQEEFSLRQARQTRPGTNPPKSNTNASNHRKPTSSFSGSGYSGPEPMDLSAVSASQKHPASGGRNKKPVDKSTYTCRRCWKKGHFPSECRAPAPVERPAHIPPPGTSKGNTPKNP